MRVVSLGSGSSGNALLIEAGPQGRTKLLIDAGLSARLLTQRLQSVNVQPSQLRGVLVTHEHSDHVLGLPIFIKRYSIPVVADPRTLIAIEKGIRTGGWRTDSGKQVFTKVEDGVESEKESQTIAFSQSIIKHITSPEELSSKREMTSILLETSIEHSLSALPTIALPVGSQCTIGDVTVTSFPVSHDAVAPCGYLIQTGGCRVCVAIDSGEVTPAMLKLMQQADLLILESNHDRERLRRGPYPWSLKKRILSSTGHLSNDQTADAVLRAWRRDRIRWLWLAHLSRTNNTPSLALDSMHAHLQSAHTNLAHIHICALPPGMGPIWDSTQLWHSVPMAVSPVYPS
ncbi:MAG TPA: MBL fold metallo-hydrolase [Ktedonobacteraceae bacterium]|jgi:phosphoribosyl 1,2-cyclic phosphodiesterase